MNRKEQKSKSEAIKVAKERAKGNPVFAKPTKEELQLLNRALNDKRQNLVQAMKGYYQLLLSKKQADIFQKRFEDAIETGVGIKDNYGLLMSKEELELEAMKNFIQLKFMNSDLVKRRIEFQTVWKLSEEDLEHYWQKWFVKGEDIE